VKTRRFALDVMRSLFGVVTDWKPNGGVFLSLHEEDPTLDGNQSTSEVYYPGYARVWTTADDWVAGDDWTTKKIIEWPKASSEMKGDVRAAFVGIGSHGSGAGYLAHIIELDGFLINKNTIPRIPAGDGRLSEK
jgi:hypothetical protein